MNTNKWFLIILVLGLFIGCTQQASAPTPTPTPQPAPTPTPTPTPTPESVGAPTGTAGGVKEFNIIAMQWEFEPSTITVMKGDEVKLHITSLDVSHGFGIAEFGIEEKLEPGKTITVEFDADNVGIYTFYCSVFCGSGHQHMKGTLIVTDE